METDELIIDYIQKETIPQFKFAPDDVIQDPSEKKKRMHDIEWAATLGNGYHGKVNILFQTAQGDIKQVQTTIWAYDQEFVTLKSGTTIPLRCILSIEHI